MATRGRKSRDLTRMQSVLQASAQGSSVAVVDDPPADGPGLRVVSDDSPDQRPTPDAPTDDVGPDGDAQAVSDSAAAEELGAAPPAAAPPAPDALPGAAARHELEAVSVPISAGNAGGRFKMNANLPKGLVARINDYERRVFRAERRKVTRTALFSQALAWGLAHSDVVVPAAMAVKDREEPTVPVTVAIPLDAYHRMLDVTTYGDPKVPYSWFALVCLERELDRLDADLPAPGTS